MARINIEEEAWKRLYRLAEIMGISVRESIGTLGCLWGNSQDQIRTHGTRNEILEWASLFGISDSDSEKWISGLEKAKFISLDKNDLYKIHGNDSQIESRISRIDRSRKGAKALMKKVKQIKALEAGLKRSPSGQQAGSNALNAIQGITLQGNAIQSNSEQGISIQDSSTQKKENPKKANAFIVRYCENFKFRYGSNPVIKGKESGIAKRLAKDLSEEKISLYLDAYFQMPDAYVVKAKHPLSLLETKFNEVTVFAHSGNFMTNKQAQQADDSASNMLLLEKVRRGEV